MDLPGSSPWKPGAGQPVDAAEGLAVGKAHCLNQENLLVILDTL